MKAISNIDLEVGSSDMPISIYSAIETETSFKQISMCCNSAVSYKKTCSCCDKVLEPSEIKKAIEVGDTLKEVDTTLIKADNGNLKILGTIDDVEENGVFKNGNVYFISYQKDKNKAKTERSLMKFSYFKEALRNSSKTFIGLVSFRGKEQIVLIKPYFNGLVCLGVYHFNLIRDVNELAIADFVTDKNAVLQMTEQIKTKQSIAIKDIENKRELLIERAITNSSGIKEEKDVLNPLELISF